MTYEKPPASSDLEEVLERIATSVESYRFTMLYIAVLLRLLCIVTLVGLIERIL